MLTVQILQIAAIGYLAYMLLSLQRRPIVCHLLPKDHGKDAALTILVVRNYVQRLVGLLNHVHLPSGSGLLLHKSKSVHTKRMLFPIDVVALSADFKVLSVVTVPPGMNRIDLPARTRHVLEIAANTAGRYFNEGSDLKDLQAYLEAR